MNVSLKAHSINAKSIKQNIPVCETFSSNGNPTDHRGIVVVNV